MNNSFKLYIHSDHLLYDTLAQSSLEFVLENNLKDIEEQIIILCTTCEQNALFAKLEKIHESNNIFLDASTYQGGKILDYFPHVKGLFNGSFINETNTIETFCKDQKAQKTLDTFLKIPQLNSYPCQFLSTGFIYPRTIAMIVNEAYFALGEEVANSYDIDRAMKYGVNYPQGPFEWVKKYQAQSFVRLLKNLNEEKGDQRYQIAPSLLKEIQ